MDLPEELVERILAHFSQLLGRPVSTRRQLVELPASDLLRLSDRLPDAFLPALVGILRGEGSSAFQRLLGDHEEENRDLSERFFSRYMALVLEPPGDPEQNPLEVWLPAEACQDLAFLSSRQAFFLRQEIRHINEWLARHFGMEPFRAGEQTEAWNALWERITRS